MGRRDTGRAVQGCPLPALPVLRGQDPDQPALRRAEPRCQRTGSADRAGFAGLRQGLLGQLSPRPRLLSSSWGGCGREDLAFPSDLSPPLRSSVAGPRRRGTFASMEKSMRVHFVKVSENAKTGPIPTSIVERVSCWAGCALYENGCYAERGALAMHWDRVSRGLAGGSWSEFCANVAVLRPGRLWRYAQAGDLPGYSPQIDHTLLRELVAANAARR